MVGTVGCPGRELSSGAITMTGIARCPIVGPLSVGRGGVTGGGGEERGALISY